MSDLRVVSFRPEHDLSFWELDGRLMVMVKLTEEQMEQMSRLNLRPSRSEIGIYFLHCSAHLVGKFPFEDPNLAIAGEVAREM